MFPAFVLVEVVTSLLEDVVQSVPGGSGSSSGWGMQSRCQHDGVWASGVLIGACRGEKAKVRQGNQHQLEVVAECCQVKKWSACRSRLLALAA